MLTSIITFSTTMVLCFIDLEHDSPWTNAQFWPTAEDTFYHQLIVHFLESSIKNNKYPSQVPSAQNDCMFC